MDVNELLKLEDERRSKSDIRLHNKSLLKSVNDLQNKLKAYELTKDVKPYKIIPSHSNKTSEAVALALFSDFHCEERISKVSTNGMNSFNPEIAKERSNKFFTGLFKLIENNRRDVKIDNLVIGMLGDNINGWIHEEYLSTNYMTPIEATIFSQECIESGLNYLIDKFKKITVVCKVGNHSRTTDKIYSETETQNSFEYILYKNLIHKFPNIHFIFEDNYTSYIDIYNLRVAFEHGHAFRYAGGIGGLYVPLIKHLVKSYSVNRFDLMCMGHWHTYTNLRNCLVNGSICGYNAYAKRKNLSPEKPMQQFQLIDKDKGLTVNTPIFL